MKKLLILSGKGGTGKTTISSAFIEFSKAKAFADCDVDAPNLDLIINPKETPKEIKFYGSKKAKIDVDKCVKCGKCKEICRFGAIKKDKNGYYIDEYSCEGCGACTIKCPTNAIKLEDDEAGKLKLYEEVRTFSTAKLKMGRGNSGKLVTEVKEQLNIKNKEKEINEIAIIDGSPGIGCPVIASITGVDFVLIVTEPSASGISDMKRIIKTVEKFRIKLAVCINKYDNCIEKSLEIEEYLKNNNIQFVGKISYDKIILDTINKQENIANIECKAKEEIKEVYNNTMKLLNN